MFNWLTRFRKKPTTVAVSPNPHPLSAQYDGYYAPVTPYRFLSAAPNYSASELAYENNRLRQQVANDQFNNSLITTIALEEAMTPTVIYEPSIPSIPYEPTVTYDPTPSYDPAPSYDPGPPTDYSSSSSDFSGGMSGGGGGGSDW